MLNLNKQIEAMNIEVMHSITVKQHNPYWHLIEYNKLKVREEKEREGQADGSDKQTERVREK